MSKIDIAEKRTAEKRTKSRKGWIVGSGFPFFFFAEVLRPLKLPCISAKLQHALLALATAEPENGTIVLHIHLPRASGEIVTAERTFSRLRHTCSLTWLFSWLRARSP